MTSAVAGASKGDLRADLEKAFAQSEFTLHYQPQIELGKGAFVGAEALLRWNHPERGLISPPVFIDTLEEMPLIRDVGHWVIQEACRQLADWEQSGIRGLRIAVNLAPSELKARDLPLAVERSLRSFGVAAGQLELEITERSLIEHTHASDTTLAELRELGVHLALDA